MSDHSREALARGEGDDDGRTPPAPPESLFRVMYEAGLQSVGEPLRLGSGRLRIEITPTQMIRLQQELSAPAIQALMLVLEHGYRPGKRIEIEGWGGPWLRQNGMRKYHAEKAASELRLKGYIRAERQPGGSQIGKQLGVVPSGLVEEVEDIPGLPRNDGRPRQAPSGAAPLSVSRFPRNGADAVDESVDNPVSRFSGNEASRNPGFRDDESVFSQVNSVSRFPGNGVSTGPTSSSSDTEEDLFFLPDPGQALTRPGLTRFFAQPALRQVLNSHWEVTVALLAREFAPQATRCAEVIAWLGDGDDEHPETRLAQILVDLVRAPPHERGPAASNQGSFLRTRGVRFKSSTPDDFVAAFVISTVTALDSARPIDSWGGWYGGGLKRDSQFQGKVLSGALGVLRRLLEDPDQAAAFDASAGGPQAGGGETAYTEKDPTYVDRLRVAVEGTNWEDEVSFAALLRNPSQQARVLARYSRVGGSGASPDHP